MEKRLSTGLDALDRQLASEEDDDETDGIPAGSLVALEAPVGAMYDPLLWGMLDEHPTVYLSTLRSEDAVAGDLERVDPVPEYQIHEVGREDPVRDVSGVVELVESQAYVFVDTVNALERGGDGEGYLDFLNESKRHLDDTGSVGVLVATETDPTPTGREYTLTVADVVWDLVTRVRGGAVEHVLHVRKFRGGDLPGEVVKLALGETVSVDTSRDIA